MIAESPGITMSLYVKQLLKFSSVPLTKYSRGSSETSIANLLLNPVFNFFHSYILNITALA